MSEVDLLVVSRRIKLRDRLRLESKLQDALGLQKIDLVIVPDIESSPFAAFVEGTGTYL